MGDASVQRGRSGSSYVLTRAFLVLDLDRMNSARMGLERPSSHA
jgi:hypothetical protein